MKIVSTNINFRISYSDKNRKQIVKQNFSDQYYYPAFRATPTIKKTLSLTNKKQIVDLVNNFERNSQFIELLGTGSFGIVYKETANYCRNRNVEKKIIIILRVLQKRRHPLNGQWHNWARKTKVFKS